MLHPLARRRRQHHRCAPDLFAQLGNPRLQACLILFGGVILGVLFQIAPFPRRADPPGDFSATSGLKPTELSFNRVALLGSHRDLVHPVSFSSSLWRRPLCRRSGSFAGPFAGLSRRSPYFAGKMPHHTEHSLTSTGVAHLELEPPGSGEVASGLGPRG